MEENEKLAALFASTSLELRPCLSQIFGSVQLLRTELGRLALQELLPDLERVEAAANTFWDTFAKHLDESGSPSSTSHSLREIRHDLRTPVGHIVGYSELLLEEISERKLSRLEADLNRLCRSARQLLALVNEGINISASDAAQAEAEAEVALPAQPAGPIRPGVDVKAEVLVVDDNDANRDLLSRYLRRLGHSVTEVSNGREALNKLEGQSFDLILLDIMMPVMDGYQALHEIKQDPALRHIPVIMISALSELDNVVTCIQMGAEDYLSKPFNPVLLQARVEASLEKKVFRDQEQKYLQQLEMEQAKSEKLLLNILPAPIASRLKRQQNTLIAESFTGSTVLFADIIGFTEASSRLTPQSLVKSLNLLFSAYDALADRYGLEKIKTIGDCYMAASGLPIPREDHAEAMIEMAFEMIEETDRLKPKLVAPFQIRCGISSGQVVAGVIGYRKFCYDLWGDTVNTASRMSGIGHDQHVRITDSTYELVKEIYDCGAPEGIEVKGKGKMLTYRVLGRKIGAESR